MKHKLEWEENPSFGKNVKAFVALSKLHDQAVPFAYRLVRRKGRWVDESEAELLEKHDQRRSWSNLSDAKRMLQNRENRFLKDL